MAVSITNGYEPRLPANRRKIERSVLAILSPLAAEMAECLTFIEKDPDAFHAWLLMKHVARFNEAEAGEAEARQALDDVLATQDMEHDAFVRAVEAATASLDSWQKQLDVAFKSMQSVNSQRLAYRASMERAKGAKGRSPDPNNDFMQLRLRYEERKQRETAPSA